MAKFITKATQGMRSTYFFAKEIAGFDKLSPKLHGEMCEKIDEYVFKKREPLAIDIPRDHFKSTIGLATAAKLFTERAIEGDFEYRTLIDCAVQELSRKHLGWIARLLSAGKEYRRCYGEFLDPKGFNQDEIFVKQRKDRSGTKREANFIATSVRSERTGFHVDFIWDDDLVGERNWGTKHLRAKVIQHFHSSLSLLEPDGRLLYTGTPWHDGDCLGMLKRAAKTRELEGLPKTFHFYHRAAMEDAAGNPDDIHGEPIFPERFSKEFLLGKKASLPKYMWSAQWMTDASLPDYALPFNRDQLYVPRATFPPYLRIKLMTIDPNFRNEDQESGDNACIMVGGLDNKANWWGIDVRLGQWKTDEFIDQIFECFVLWRPQRIRIEKKFTSHLMNALQSESSRRGIILPIELIERDWRGKEVRFAGLQPLFASNRIKFASEIDKLVKEEMEEEFERVGASAHDDILDTLADQFQGGLMPLVTDQETYVAPDQRSLTGLGPSWMYTLEAMGFRQERADDFAQPEDDPWG